MLLKVVIPKSSQELYEHLPALNFLATFLEEIPRNYIENLLASTPNIILLYSIDNLPMAICQCDFIEKSVKICEIHGIIRQDLKEFLPRRNMLANLIVKTILNLLFENLSVEKILVAYDFKTLAILGFIRRFGFSKRLTTSEFQYYELSRKVYFQKVHPILNKKEINHGIR